MQGMFKGTYITALDSDQDPQASLMKKMGNFDEADLQKIYTRAYGKYDETETIASRTIQISRKLQKRK